MKKTIAFLILVLISFSLVFSLTACKPQNEIVGEWIYDHFDLSNVKPGYSTANGALLHMDTLTFNKDGTVTVGGVAEPDSWKVYWSYDSKAKNFRITSCGQDALNDDNLVDLITISGKTMIVAYIHVYKKA